jgi:cell wall-associated NlpC family hydrolase
VLLVVTAIATTVSRAKASALGQKVVDKIKTVIGTPYIWGGSDPGKGFDCSGVVVWALQQLGLEPKKFDGTAAELHKKSSLVLVPQVGDLAFYGSLFGGVSHVMVYMGDGKVIGASGGGSSTTTAAKAREQNAMVKILPVDYRSDFRGYGRLPYKPPAETMVGGLHMMGAC